MIIGAEAEELAEKLAEGKGKDARNHYETDKSGQESPGRVYHEAFESAGPEVE